MAVRIVARAGSMRRYRLQGNSRWAQMLQEAIFIKRAQRLRRGQDAHQDLTPAWTSQPPRCPRLRPPALSQPPLPELVRKGAEVRLVGRHVDARGSLCNRLKRGDLSQGTRDDLGAKKNLCLRIASEARTRGKKHAGALALSAGKTDHIAPKMPSIARATQYADRTRGQGRPWRETCPCARGYKGSRVHSRAHEALRRQLNVMLLEDLRHRIPGIRKREVASRALDNADFHVSHMKTLPRCRGEPQRQSPMKCKYRLNCKLDSADRAPPAPPRRKMPLVGQRRPALPRTTPQYHRRSGA